MTHVSWHLRLPTPLHRLLPLVSSAMPASHSVCVCVCVHWHACVCVCVYWHACRSQELPYRMLAPNHSMRAMIAEALQDQLSSQSHTR